jgi:hypothetical protein
VWGGGQDDDIDVAVHDLLVRVKPNEPSLFWYVHSVAIRISEMAAATFESIIECIAHGIQHNAGVGFEGLASSAAAAAAAANEPNSNLAISRCMR